MVLILRSSFWRRDMKFMGLSAVRRASIYNTVRIDHLIEEDARLCSC